MRRHLLGDHAAHRCPDDVRPLDFEGIEEIRDIVCHVDQQVRRLRDRLTVQQRRQVRHTGGMEMGGEPDVAVVEPHHPETTTGQLPAEIHIPAQQLAAQTRDQHERRIVAGAERLVRDLDLTALGKRDGAEAGLWRLR